MAEMDPRTGKLERLTIRCACGYTVTWTKQAILAKAGPWRRPAELARALRHAGPWGQHFPEPLFHGVFQLVEQRVVGD